MSTAKDKLAYYRKLAAEMPMPKLEAHPNEDELCTCGLGEPYDTLHVSSCPAHPMQAIHAELSRLKARLSDREALAKVISDAFGISPAVCPCCRHSKHDIEIVMSDAAANRVTVGVIAYLKGKES
jgi:hypothetical protein